MGRHPRRECADARRRRSHHHRRCRVGRWPRHGNTGNGRANPRGRTSNDWGRPGRRMSHSGWGTAGETVARRRTAVEGRSSGWGTTWVAGGRSSNARRRTSHRRSHVWMRAGRGPAWMAGWGSSRRVSLPTLLGRPRLGLSLELMQGLLRGVRNHRVLSVHLFLGKLIHHLSHAALASKAHAAEAFALSVRSVLVELDLDEVGNAQVLDRVCDVLVRCPPGQVPDVQLPSAAFGPSRVTRR